MSPTKNIYGQKSPSMSSMSAFTEKRTPVKTLPPNVVRVMVEGESIDITYDPEQIMQISVGWLVNEVVKRYGMYVR